MVIIQRVKRSNIGRIYLIGRGKETILFDLKVIGITLDFFQSE